MKKVSPRVISRASLCLIFLPFALLFSCGDKKADNENTIQYVSMWNEEEPQAQFLLETGKLFTEETGISIDFHFEGRDVLVKIRSSILMKDPPDLVDQDINELKAVFILDNEVLVDPLTDIFLEMPGPEGQDRLIDIFPQKEMELYNLEDQIYFFPYEYITSGFFYNKNLYEKMELSPPTNWKEFMTNNDILKGNGISPLVLDGSIPFYNAYYFYWIVTRLMGPKQFRLAAEDKLGKAWNHPGFLEAAQIVSNMSSRGNQVFQQGYQESHYPNAQELWARGGAGAVLCGSWIPSETLINREFEVGFFPFPRMNDVHQNSIEAYLIGCAIPQGAKNKESAIEFLRFLVRKENAERLVNQTLNLSVRMDITYPESLKEVKEYVDSGTIFHAPYSGVWFHHPRWFQHVFYPLDNQLIFGQISPDEFIDKIRSQTIQFWENNS